MKVGSRNLTKSRHPFYLGGLLFVARAGIEICIIEHFSVAVVKHEDR